MNHKVDIPQIQLKRSVRRHADYAMLKEQLVTEFKKIPDLKDLKMNIELLKCLCNVVENAVGKANKSKIDKKHLVMVVLKELFNDLTDEQMLFIDEQIDYLCENNDVKVMSCFRSLYNFFLRR